MRLSKEFWDQVAASIVVSFICCFCIYLMFVFTIKEFNVFDWEQELRAMMCIIWTFAIAISFGFVEVYKD